MKKFEILQERQENGLWGISFNCYSIDKFLFLGKRKELLFSAALALLDQTWNCPYKITNSSEYGFIISVDVDGGRTLSFRYERYELIDNILYEFETDKEHTIFLRKHKLKKLNNELYCSLEK